MTHTLVLIVPVYKTTPADRPAHCNHLPDALYCCLSACSLSMLVVQTISLMFGQTEKGPSHSLTSKQSVTSHFITGPYDWKVYIYRKVISLVPLLCSRGSVTAALLLALVCDPELKSHNCTSASHTEVREDMLIFFSNILKYCYTGNHQGEKWSL